MYFELSLTDAWKSTRNWITRIESRTSFVDFLLSGGLTFVSSPVFTTDPTKVSELVEFMILTELATNLVLRPFVHNFK